MRASTRRVTILTLAEMHSELSRSGRMPLDCPINVPLGSATTDKMWILVEDGMSSHLINRLVASSALVGSLGRLYSADRVRRPGISLKRSSRLS